MTDKPTMKQYVLTFIATILGLLIIGTVGYLVVDKLSNDVHVIMEQTRYEA